MIRLMCQISVSSDKGLLQPADWCTVVPLIYGFLVGVWVARLSLFW